MTERDRLTGTSWPAKPASGVRSKSMPEGPLTKTRVSLLYLSSYLLLIGLGLLFAPHETLKILQSNKDYGDVFPRVAGMLMSGMGLSIFGIIRARASTLYPATLAIRMYFIACFLVFHVMTRDPLFLVLVGIVGLGFVLTLTAYLLDRAASASEL